MNPREMARNSSKKSRGMNTQRPAIVRGSGGNGPPISGKRVDAVNSMKIPAPFSHTRNLMFRFAQTWRAATKA